MAYCPQCGAALSAGARYCARCGTATTQPTLPHGHAAPPPPHAPPAPPAGAPARRRDTSGAEAVILIGAVLAGLLPLAFGLGVLFFGAFFAAFIPFWGAIPAAFFAFFALALIAGGVVFGALGVWARNVVRDGEPEKGGLLAAGTGLVACLLGNVLGGLVLILGGILAYAAK